MIRTGLDRIAAGERTWVANRKVGLIAHPASVTSTLVHASRVLREAGARLEAFFGPEHGYGGEAQDMAVIDGARSPDGVPIHSLYGDTLASLAPTAEQLAGLDVLVVDLQDVGSRYYTFVWTAVLALQAASAVGVETLILDRPNPLGGVAMEGAPQSEGFLSFVGLHPVPVRHAMTVGEIVRMAQERMALSPDSLLILPMTEWDARKDWSGTGLPWILPSPNMPTLDTAFVYPGGCLIEGTTLSEGRGTTRPFELFGAPWLDGRALAELAIDGAMLRPCTFQPMFQKHAGSLCGGVQVHVTDRERFASYSAYATMLATIRNAYPDSFGWRTEPYEMVDDIPAIDLLSGSSDLRFAIESGDVGEVDEVLRDQASHAERFADERERWLLYPR